MSKRADVNAPVVTCNYAWTDTDGTVETCRAAAKCPICGQCSKIIDEKEHGHCPGHLGLTDHIGTAVPNRSTL